MSETMQDMVRALTLIYRESEIEDQTEATKEVVEELCNNLNMPASVDLDRTREVIDRLKSLLLKLITDGVKFQELDREHITQEVKLASQGREDVLDNFVSGIEPIEDADKLKRIRNKLRADLSNALATTGIRKKMADLMKKFRTTQGHKMPDMLAEMAQELDVMVNRFSKGIEAKRGSQSILLSDTENVKKVFDLSKTEDNPKLFLEVGWAFLKEMLGEVAKLRRGDMVGVYALQHNFKSGFVNNIGRQIVEFNPNFVPLDETKKPLIIILSTENHLQENLKDLFKQIMENETGKVCNVNRFDTEYMAKYVDEWQKRKGWEVALLREDPSDFTYRDMIALVEHYEARGYEVVSIICDYLAMCSTKGCYQGIGGGTGMDIRGLFRRTRNYMASKSILFITPHQLSTTAKSKLTEYAPAKFLEMIANKGMLDSCGTIDQEFDLEIYIHIVVVGDKKYLTLRRGKHRGVNNTAICHLGKVVPFQEIAALPDDLDAPRHIAKVPGATSGVEEW